MKSPETKIAEIASWEPSDLAFGGPSPTLPTVLFLNRSRFSGASSATVLPSARRSRLRSRSERRSPAPAHSVLITGPPRRRSLLWEGAVMWFVRSSNVIQPNCRKQLRGLWVEGVRGSSACLENQAEQSRPILYVDLIWAPPLLPKSQTYTTFIYSSWSACYRAARNTN